MIFPDPRERLATPAFNDDKLDALKLRSYRDAFVENAGRDEMSFAFLRPPGWEVREPVLDVTEEMPFPSVASIIRKNPAAGIEIQVFEAPFDVLPGDLLDAYTDAATLSHFSEGPLGAGFYADRAGTTGAGYMVCAAHRIGKDVWLGLCAMPMSAKAKALDEALTILGTLSLKHRPPALADDWAPHGQRFALDFEVPALAERKKMPGGFSWTWDLSTGHPDEPGDKNAMCAHFAATVPSRMQRRLEDVEGALARELGKHGLAFERPGRGNDLPAQSGGPLADDVVIRTYAPASDSAHPMEVTLLLGTLHDGTRVRVSAAYPARSSHKTAWMRARFAIARLAETLRAP